MSNPIQSATVTRFKGISNATFDASPINVFIGSNNSGKSTLVQAIHFGVGILQSIELIEKWGNADSVTRSLSPSELLYSPCMDLYCLGRGGKLQEVRGVEGDIQLALVLDDGERINITIKKGRNGNINVRVDNVTAAKELANLSTPYTIYSPGLAGIARHENFISDGVLLRTIARGDANLVFRNILLRLHRIDAWSDFMDDLRMIFPDIELGVTYDEKTDEFVMVSVKSGAARVPVELAGTGILQAVQILVYVHYFHPSVILLDEPDSHLHPNNQRLLCRLLQGVAEERDTQVFLTTHSRHVVDALSGQANFLWVQNGTVEKMGANSDLAVLLDIGALDVREMLINSPDKCIVLTEDSLKRRLELLLEASGFPMDDTLVLAYHGCTSTHNLTPLLEHIRNSNPNGKIVVHRDRDYLTTEEAAEWEISIRNMHAEPFFTDGVDIESHYLDAEHIAHLNSLDANTVQTMLEEATTATKDTSIEKYVNGRTDIIKKAGKYRELNPGQLATEAPTQVDASPDRYRHAKTVLKEVRRKFQEDYGSNLRVIEPSPHLAVGALVEIAARL